MLEGINVNNPPKSFQGVTGALAENMNLETIVLLKNIVQIPRKEALTVGPIERLARSEELKLEQWRLVAEERAKLFDLKLRDMFAMVFGDRHTKARDAAALAAIGLRRGVDGISIDWDNVDIETFVTLDFAALNPTGDMFEKFFDILAKAQATYDGMRKWNAVATQGGDGDPAVVKVFLAEVSGKFLNAAKAVLPPPGDIDPEDRVFRQHNEEREWEVIRWIYNYHSVRAMQDYGRDVGRDHLWSVGTARRHVMAMLLAVYGDVTEAGQSWARMVMEKRGVGAPNRRDTLGAVAVAAAALAARGGGGGR